MSIARRAQIDKEIEDLDTEIAELEKSQRQRAEGVEEPTNKETNEPQPQTTEEATYKKRYGDLRRYSEKTKTDLEKKIQALTDQIEQLKKSDNSVPTSEEQVREWAAKNPHASAIIRAIAKEQAGNDPQLRQLKAEMEEIESLKSTIHEDRLQARILKAHPDFNDIKEDDAFHDWAETQPKILQAAIYDSNDPDDIISVINLYKKEKGIKPLTDRDAVRSVKSPGAPKPSPDKGKGRFTESIVEKMSAADFEKYEDEIMEEMRTNPHFYDLSGGTR